ncbi:MAG: hypothetical protein GY874_08915, partial [Desulfobacteraceae bacterium]|nr:hypothetical protein [Desulfobacteraceae bacterium]
MSQVKILLPPLVLIRSFCLLILMLLKSRFDDILKYLSFTTLKPPAFKDKFWQVRQMMKEWNENMT